MCLLTNMDLDFVSETIPGLKEYISLHSEELLRTGKDLFRLFEHLPPLPYKEFLYRLRLVSLEAPLTQCAALPKPPPSRILASKKPSLRVHFKLLRTLPTRSTVYKCESCLSEVAFPEITQHLSLHH